MHLGSRLARRLALGSLAVFLPSLAVTLIAADRAARNAAVATSFADLDSIADLALAAPPADADALVEWALRLAAFRDPDRDPADRARLTPTRRERRVTLIARDGAVLADSHEDAETMDNHADRPEVIEAFRAGYGRSQRFSETRGETLTYIAARLPWSPEVVLRLSEPVFRIEQTIQSILTPIAIVAAVATLMFGALSFWFSSRFTTRVERLRRFSARVAEGDFRPEPPPARGDELDQLLVALNQTAERLQSTFQSLSEERNQGATILSSMSEGVIVLDSDLRIQYLNRASRETLSLPGDSWTDYRLRDARDVLEGKKLVKLAKGAVRGRRNERRVSIRGRDILVRGAPIRSELPGEGGYPAEGGGSENPLGGVLVMMDVTELQRLERVRRDFVANISHELRTPLTTIRGFAETLLAGHDLEPERRARFLDLIREHSIRLSRLTDDLLRLARIEAGRLELDIAPVRVADVADSVIESARLKAGARALRFEERAPAPVVRTDATALAEILQNLVDNAVQYSPEDGTVRVVSDVENGQVLISVQDDGPGIGEEHRTRIFERFYRVDAARSREVGGTGLGLAIAKHLAESLDGTLSVESVSGGGSTFTLSLPADD